MTDPIPMGRKMKPTIAKAPTSLWTQKKATGAEATMKRQARIVRHGELPDCSQSVKLLLIFN